MNLALCVTAASHVSFLITKPGVSVLLWWPWAFCLPMLAHPGSPCPEPGGCMARPFFLEPRPLMRSSWHNMSLQSQLANSQDQTKGLLSKEASKESVLTSQGLPPHSVLWNLLCFRVLPPSDYWEYLSSLRPWEESGSCPQSACIPDIVSIPDRRCPEEIREEPVCFKTSGCPKNQRRC